MSYIQPVITVLLHPTSAWGQIAREEIIIRDLFIRYIFPWAGLIPLTFLIAWSSIEFPNEIAGQKILFAPTKLQLVIIAVVGYLANVMIVPLTAYVANAKAVAFSGEKNLSQAMKLATFSLIPAWMTTVTVLVPLLSILQLFALFYSPYLFLRGIPILMKIPQEKVMSYALTVGTLTAVAFLGIFLVVGPLILLTLGSLNP